MAGFNHGEILNGFDAWRRLVVPLKPRTDAKRIDMHSSVHNPGRSSNLLGMKQDIETWEDKVKEFET